jgi:hypothetical protein
MEHDQVVEDEAPLCGEKLKRVRRELRKQHPLRCVDRPASVCRLLVRPALYRA